MRTEGVKGAIGKPPWENLAQAIILQAVDDYRKCRRLVRQKPDQKEAQKMIREVEQFLCSRWFSQLADGIIRVCSTNQKHNKFNV